MFLLQVKKQSSSRSSCIRCVPTITSQSQQKHCPYGECNGHSKTEMTAATSSCKLDDDLTVMSLHYKFVILGTHLVPSTSSGITRNFCCSCNQTLVNRKLEIENMKTKSKLDHLKLVMQQKKERREARKLKIAPSYTQLGSLVSIGSQPAPTAVLDPIMPESSSINDSSLLMPGSSTSLNESTDSSSSSSATTATAIATSISTNNSEIENHLEEVDTVA